MTKLETFSFIDVPCNRSSAGSLWIISDSKVKAVHVMLVLFLSSDVTTVSVDMAEIDVTGTSVNSYPSLPLKILCSFASHRTISPTYVQVKLATPLSVVFTDWGEIVISVWERDWIMKQKELKFCGYINNLPFFYKNVCHNNKYIYNSQLWQIVTVHTRIFLSSILFANNSGK